MSGLIIFLKLGMYIIIFSGVRSNVIIISLAKVLIHVIYQVVFFFTSLDMSVKETQNIKNFKIQNSNRNFAIKSEQGPLPSAYTCPRSAGKTREAAIGAFCCENESRRSGG